MPFPFVFYEIVPEIARTRMVPILALRRHFFRGNNRYEGCVFLAGSVKYRQRLQAHARRVPGPTPLLLRVFPTGPCDFSNNTFLL